MDMVVGVSSVSILPLPRYGASIWRQHPIASSAAPILLVPPILFMLFVRALSNQGMMDDRSLDH